jgi:hypothetical protein
MPDLELLTRRLLEHRVECVLIGGFAALAYGVTLVTRSGVGPNYWSFST